MSSEKICFIISPIGDPDSPERKLAYDKYDLIFHPVLTESSYTPIRADKKNASKFAVTLGVVQFAVNLDPVQNWQKFQS